jgi:hypothetical protein
VWDTLLTWERVKEGMKACVEMSTQLTRLFSDIHGSHSEHIGSASWYGERTPY